MSDVPLDAIANGRGFAAVLDAFTTAYKDAEVVLRASGAEMQTDDAASRLLGAAAYRVYLLGVEDGMSNK